LIPTSSGWLSGRIGLEEHGGVGANPRGGLVEDGRWSVTDELKALLQWRWPGVAREKKGRSQQSVELLIAERARAGRARGAVVVQHE
jgi:hypothetical protein